MVVMITEENQLKKIYSDIIQSNAYEVVREIKTIMERLMVTSDIDAEKQFDIKVILSELLQNAITHGNGCDNDKKIYIDVWLQENSKVLSISVRDQGPGFDPSPVLNLSGISGFNPENMDESGRGLLIVQNLCDYLEFNTMGNAVTVTKRL